jgi:hypothetical protein
MHLAFSLGARQALDYPGFNARLDAKERSSLHDRRLRGRLELPGIIPRSTVNLDLAQMQGWDRIEVDIDL